MNALVHGLLVCFNLLIAAPLLADHLVHDETGFGRVLSWALAAIGLVSLAAHRPHRVTAGLLVLVCLATWLAVTVVGWQALNLPVHVAGTVLLLMVLRVIWGWSGITAADHAKAASLRGPPPPPSPPAAG